MEEEKVLRLTEKRKKGIFRVVFGRMGLILLLILLQLAMLLMIYHRFEEYFHWFSVGFAALSVVMLFYLFNCDMDSSAKLTWLNLIMLFPIPGTIFLLFTKTNIGHRTLQDRVEYLITETKDLLPMNENILNEPEAVDSCTDDLCRYVCRSGCFPLYKATDVTYFPLGEDKFAALIEELQKAEKFIFLEYFIIDEGYMWGRVLSILADKVKHGVDVRVLYDGMCEIVLLPHDYPKRMEKLGIKCRAFSPITPFISTHYNYRDHRKILVIDGKVAFNGGVNLSDEYINRGSRFGSGRTLP